MTLVNVMGASAKHHVMRDTWGHLYPTPGSRHEGHVIIVYAEDGTVLIVQEDFPTLEGSPQRAEVLSQVLDVPERHGLRTGLYRVDCTLWFYKTSSDMYLNKPVGRLCKPQVRALWTGA